MRKGGRQGSYLRTPVQMDDLRQAVFGFLLRSLSPIALDQQPGNHGRLDCQRKKGARQLPPVAFPRRWFAKLHDTRGGQSCFTDVPRLKVSAVVRRDPQLNGRRPKATARFSSQNTNGNFGCLAPELLSGDDRAADYAMTEIAIEIAKYRRIGSFAQQGQCTI